MTRKPVRLPALATILLLLAAPAHPQGAAWIAEHYEKREVMIPMRDGARLSTAVYTPRADAEPLPILLLRTPYSRKPYGPDAYPGKLGPSALFGEQGYVFAVQDVRGCYLSEGEFVNMRPHDPEKSTPADVDESSDTWDTIEWLLANVPGNNGRVGMHGISYPGFYCSAGMIDAHPALKAVSPQAPIADWWHDDFHHNGAFFLPHAFGFFANFGRPRPEPVTTRPWRAVNDTPDGYQFFLDLGPLGNVNELFFLDGIPFWNDIVAHPNRDEFWQSRNILPHLRNVAPAVLTVGGWFDAEDLYGTLNTYRAIEEQNPDVYNALVMGPWRHGGWARDDGDRLGKAHFGSKTSLWYREKVELPFFEHFLKDRGELDLAEATVFDTGAKRWRHFPSWPPEGIREGRYYLQVDGLLSMNLPRATVQPYTEYFSDPKKPVPFTEAIAPGMTREYMTDDQRFAARRPDVLTFRGEMLHNKRVLAGPVVFELFVSTSREDSDWIVKLIDEFPGDAINPPDAPANWHAGGYQMMVRSEVLRGRFREDAARPTPFEPNEPTMVRIELQDVMHTFERGHRMVVQIQSTWFPLVDRNPQGWVDNIFEAEKDDFQGATNRVYHVRDFPSRLLFNAWGMGG